MARAERRTRPRGLVIKIGWTTAFAAAVLLLASCAASTIRGSGTTVASSGSTTTTTTSTASLTPTPSATSSTPSNTVTVAGRQVSAAEVHTVADAIAAAGIQVPDGRLLSVVTGRTLNPHLNPAVILIDGKSTTLTSPVHAGDTITFIAGHDVVEQTKVVVVPVPLAAAAAALYVSYHQGTAKVTVGTVSGEQASSITVQPPSVGRLRTPEHFAITFDDGPNSPYTAEILNLLQARSVPAVFCVIGANAILRPALVRQEATAGHQLCDHTQTHPVDLPNQTTAQITSQIVTGAKSITSASGGVAPRYFRAPDGNWSATITAVARAQHLIPLHWTVDPRDWSKPGVATIVTSVLNQLRPNGIVLMHDGGGDRSQTFAALSELLPELQAAGWIASYPTWIQ